MFTVTGPAIAIALIIGYLGVNAVVNEVSGWFKNKEGPKEDK